MTSTPTHRKFQLPLSELVDRLTISQIKLAFVPQNRTNFNKEIEMLNHDIDLIIQNNELRLNAKLISALVQLSQINLHIWNNKDLMQANLDNETEYLSLLKLAHQLNGIRNSIKNYLVELEGNVEDSHKRSNFETDGLDWDFKI